MTSIKYISNKFSTNGDKMENSLIKAMKINKKYRKRKNTILSINQYYIKNWGGAYGSTSSDAYYSRKRSDSDKKKKESSDEESSSEDKKDKKKNKGKKKDKKKDKEKENYIF